MNIISRYAKIYYDVPKILNISMTEYILLDMISQLSKDRWCIKSITNIADDLSMSRNGVQKMKNRLIAKGLIEKNEYGHIRTTEAYHSVVRTFNERTTRLHDRTTQLYETVPLSGTKINNRLTKDNTNMVKEENRGVYSPAKEKLRKARLTGDWSYLTA